MKNTIKANIYIYWPLLVLFIFWSCQGKDKNGEPLSTPTSGEINIVADKTLKPIIDAEIDVFEAIYKNTEINVNYLSEVDAINKFLQDSAVLAVLTRTLTAEELEPIASQHIVPSKIKIAKGAIALITNNKNPDSLLTMNQIRSIFNGEIERWNQINPNYSSSQIQLIFSNQNASTVRFVKDSIATGKLPANTFAVSANNKVIDYVAQNENALGIIGVTWISDQDDPKTLGFLKQIQVMAISNTGNTNDYYKPYQAYIAKGLYPINRNIYIVSREARSGLGSGFMTFVAGAKGQRVILKAGLVPANMPVRIVAFENSKSNN